MSCLLSFTNQYRKNNALIKTKKEVPKFITESTENVFGGKNREVYENNRTTATIPLMKYMILSITFNFFITTILLL